MLDVSEVRANLLIFKSVNSLSKHLGISRSTLKSFCIKNDITLPTLKEATISSNKRRQNSLKATLSTNSDEIKEKRKQTNLHRYGISNPFEDKDKIQQSVVSKLGVSRPLYSSLSKEKMKQTNLHRYGSEVSLLNPEVKAKSKETCLQKYGSPFYTKGLDSYRESQVSSFKSRLLADLSSNGYILLDEYEGQRNFSENSVHESYKQYHIKHIACGNIFMDDIFSLPRCPKCFSTPFRSQQEEYYASYLESMGIRVQRNVHIVPWTSKQDEYGRKFYHETDIFLPDFNIGFEINGLYTHSSYNNIIIKGTHIKPKHSSYHIRKTKDHLSQGISLYHIWEDDNKNIVKSMLSSLVGEVSISLRASKCFIKDSLEVKDFLNSNHLHGYAPYSFSFSLVHGDSIVSSMTFKILPKNRVELSRFCSSLNHKIHGGFSKLFKHAKSFLFLRGYSTILSYAYIDWSPNYKSTIYHNQGFSYEGTTPPSLFYYKKSSNRRFSRQKYQKHKLKKLFPESYSDSLTANQILSLQGIYPIYNSGNHKFLYFCNIL